MNELQHIGKARYRLNARVCNDSDTIGRRSVESNTNKYGRQEMATAKRAMTDGERIGTNKRNDGARF